MDLLDSGRVDVGSDKVARVKKAIDDFDSLEPGGIVSFGETNKRVKASYR